MSQNINLIDLFALQHDDRISGLIEDFTTYSPELGKIPVVTRPGTDYNIVKRTALPTGSFRQIGGGATFSKSAYKQEKKQMYFLDFPINIDEAIYQADDQSTGSIMVHEMQGLLQSVFIYVGSQFYYGHLQDPNGFYSIRDQLAGAVQVGTAGNQSASTSAYLAWLNPDWGIRFDVGKLGAISVNPPVRQQIVVPSPGTGSAFYWVTNLSMFIGLSVLSSYSTWAVNGVNTTTFNSTVGLTDKLGEQLRSTIPLVRQNGLVWLMNKTSYYSLQQNRTAIGNFPAGSRGYPAFSPAPEQLAGYPIIQSESILNTENN